MNLGRGKSGSNFLTRMLRRRQYSDGVVVRGDWSMSNRSPLVLSDPQKALHILQRTAPWTGDLHRTIARKGVAPYSILKRFPPLFIHERREFDKLVTGGGNLRWLTDWSNLVVNVGLDHLLDVTLSNGTQNSNWYVGLLAASPSPAAGWTTTEIDSNDFVDYSESNLQAWTDGGVTSQSVTNSGNTADFSIDTNSSSIGGAYLISNNTKGTAAGTLYAAGAFSGGNKAADDGDTLQVTATFTMAAA